MEQGGQVFALSKTHQQPTEVNVQVDTVAYTHVSYLVLPLYPQT